MKENIYFPFSEREFEETDMSAKKVGIMLEDFLPKAGFNRFCLFLWHPFIVMTIYSLFLDGHLF